MRIGLLTPVCLAAFASGCGRASEEASSKAFDDSYLSACLSSATTTGLPAQSADRLCNCALTSLNEKYSASEKVALSPQETLPIIEQCAMEMVQR